MSRFSGNDDEMFVSESEQTALEPVVKKEEPKPAVVEPTNGMDQDEMLNSLQKKVYVFDESGSMASSLPREEGKSEDEREVKMDLVKRIMKRFVTDRFKRYPNSQISVLGFGNTTRVICKAGAKWKEVQDAIDELKADSGTDILQAVEFAVQHVEEEPSKLKTNQIIFVSDGLDEKARKVGKFASRLKKLNITFDFIYVRSERAYFGYDRSIDALRELCKETGGE